MAGKEAEMPKWVTRIWKWGYKIWFIGNSVDKILNNQEIIRSQLEDIKSPKEELEMLKYNENVLDSHSLTLVRRPAGYPELQKPPDR